VSTTRPKASPGCCAFPTACLCINARYKRIVADERHHDVVLLGYEEIVERAFPGWTMGQVNLHRLNAALLLKYSETGRLDPYNMSGAAMAALFREMCASGAIEVH
jgi:hypothetical protein